MPSKDVEDARELLRWLADEHFTFLGYREYRLGTDESGDDFLAALNGTGLGILRQDQTQVRSFKTMPPGAQERIREKRLLVITKANARATVHRNAYLDYIGIKVFGPDGEVSGERRFLGLFSSAAYLESVKKLPVVRRKVADVLTRSGLSKRSHSGKDLISIERRTRETSSSRPRPARSTTSQWPSYGWPAVGCCGCSSAATRTAGSSPAWSTCRATATPRRTGCGCSRS